MKKILIIEDEVSIAQLEKDYLEASQYQVQIENTGDGGLAAALAGDFDLILLDIMLPGMDGFQVLSEIRKVKEVPVLLVTARMDDIDKIKGFNNGADDYVMKPFSFFELVARVGAHIARYEKLTGLTRKKADEIRVGGIRIIQSTHQVFLGDSEVAMANKEFELLAFLAAHPGEVFSKNQLLDHVWGVDAYVEQSTVAVHVNRLREKIESDKDNPEYIQTVWGVGYKLSPIPGVK